MCVCGRRGKGGGVRCGGGGAMPARGSNQSRASILPQIFSPAEPRACTGKKKKYIKIYLYIQKKKKKEKNKEEKRKKKKKEHRARQRNYNHFYVLGIGNIQRFLSICTIGYRFIPPSSFSYAHNSQHLWQLLTFEGVSKSGERDRESQTQRQREDNGDSSWMISGHLPSHMGKQCY